jgi:hypothetical protein
VEEREMMFISELPTCQKCKKSLLVPLSDYGPEGSTVAIKVWVCINEACGWMVRADKGVVSYDKARK